MRKIIFTLTFSFLALTASAQGFFDHAGGSGTTGTLLRNNAIDKKDSNISGTPYMEDKFFNSEVSGVPEKVMTRYNAATDEIEIKKEDDNKEFLLPKVPEYGRVNSKYGKYILKLVDYKTSKGESVNGYLVELWTNGTSSFFRRDKIKLEEGREGNGYTGYTPPKYTKVMPEYYFQINGKEIMVFPKNKKGLTEIFKDKKSQIDTFFKANDLSFKDEKDMSKITQFVSTL